LAAKNNVRDGAVTFGYQADRKAVITLLNIALATELVCVLRYKRYYYTVTGRKNSSVKAQFLLNAVEEQGHADQLAARIIQLNGQPDLNPATLNDRSEVAYDDSMEIDDMITTTLVAERIAIESYRQMLGFIGDSDPTTRQMLVAIMAMEEEHADEMRDLLE
jgi:bacterioferritin